MKRIETIVLTGAPCAGKTSALEIVKSEFERRGWAVITVGETATELKQSGVAPWDLVPGEFQRIRLKLQVEKEAAYFRAAKAMSAERVLIVFDRGALDTRCYTTAEQFASFAHELGESEVLLRDRYGAVFHMETAAKGARESYVTGEGTVRYDTAEECVDYDARLVSAWCGHPHLRMIGCEENYADKASHLVREIASFLGDPVPYEIERKFLIEYPDLDFLKNYPFCKKVEIEQVYLEGRSRIRRRGADGSYIYFYTEKRKVNEVRRVEEERRITKSEYEALFADKEPGRGIVKKDRYCIVYDGKYFELDVYPIWRDRATLEIELSSEDEEFKIPDFIKVIREVTGEKEYKNYNISKLYED
ncbi:MAG: AAA family ATPase [Clostridia bacterium]|nr:AAA family ATPase [Clostridia bacterium]